MPFAANEGARIHFDVEGDGPPLVLLHGFGVSGDEISRAQIPCLLLPIAKDFFGSGINDGTTRAG